MNSSFCNSYGQSCLTSFVVFQAAGVGSGVARGLETSISPNSGWQMLDKGPGSTVHEMQDCNWRVPSPDGPDRMGGAYTLGYGRTKGGQIFNLPFFLFKKKKPPATP